MLNVIQGGRGPARVLVVAYFIADTDALLQEMPDHWCVVVDNNNAGGRFARPAGAGGVDRLLDAQIWVRYKVGVFETTGVVLIGFSAGVQAVREQLGAGAYPIATLALDGTSGSVPPTAAQIDPWREEAKRARAEQTTLLLTHTLQTYTELLPPSSRYLATVNGCRKITGWPLNDFGPLDDPAITVEGQLVVASYHSARIDEQAHRDQQNVAMPDMLRRFIVPWVERRGDSEPHTPRPPSEPPTRRNGLLRRDDEGADVAAWQKLLTRAGYGVVADGDFGPRTESATRSLQHDVGLVQDGVVGPLTRAAADARIRAREHPTHPDIPRALTEEEKDGLFGRLIWTADEPPSGQIRITAGLQLARVYIPQLKGVEGAPSDATVLFHKLGATRLQELFVAWEKAGLLPLVLTWSGSFAPRRVRGSTGLSSHARGIAMDLNAPWNPRGGPAAPKGTKGSMGELVGVAEALGWFSGRHWSTPDEMHIELSS